MTLNIKNTVVSFDLDDTLYNELDFLRSAYMSIANKLANNDWKLLYAQMFSLYRSNIDVFGFLSESYQTDKKWLLKEYRKHIPNIAPFDHVVDLLKKIKNLEGKIAIITDGRENTQRNKIDSLGLKKYVDLIVISEAVGSEKPNEKNYKIVESTFPNHKYCYIL